MTTPVDNAKSSAWDHVGGMFWSQGRTSARPSPAELEQFLTGVPAGQRCTVVGASTKDLVEAARDHGALVTVLDFSRRMCEDLGAAVPDVEVRQVDITRPLPVDLRATQDWVFADRLVNRFAPEEVAAGVAGILGLLSPGGTVRTSVKIGRYPMDDEMIAVGERHGTVREFWDEETDTIDFSTAGAVLEEALLPHGEIDRALLLSWYRGRGREKRYSEDDVRVLLSGVSGLPADDVHVAALQDAPGSLMFTLVTPDAG